MVPISVTDGSEGLAMQSTETEARRKELLVVRETSLALLNMPSMVIITLLT